MNQSLLGRQIVNTRATHQACELDRMISVRGGRSIPYPCIAIGPPQNVIDLDQALSDLLSGEFAWVVFASANSVHGLSDRLRATGHVPRIPRTTKVAVVGRASERHLEDRFGQKADFVPGQQNAVALASGLPICHGEAVLLPGSDISRPELPEILASKGAAVTSVAAYRTFVGTGGANVPGLIAEMQVNAITFSSPSAVDGFALRFLSEGGRTALLDGIAMVAIGETTLNALNDHGLTGLNLDTVHSLDGLVETLERYFSGVPAGGHR
ncbi:uroporphyrinogen-III synthase [soil metagenome]